LEIAVLFKNVVYLRSMDFASIAIQQSGTSTLSGFRPVIRNYPVRHPAYPAL
jgi:hypothetical protein